MNQFVRPATSGTAVDCPIQAYIERLYQTYQQETGGQVADYIPDLALADPGSFAISLATIDGQIYEVGCADEEFTIQSVSKPFVYGIALEDQGLERVLSKVGVEPSGDAFNEISLDKNGRPKNPMINAGAIATAGLVGGTDDGAKFQRVLDVFSRYAGRELGVNESVYRSESETGHRNRAIGHMLRNFDILTEDPNPTLERYFRQCSISVRCRDLALMAATLANGGLNPVTGTRALDERYCGNVLSIMASCGMYDYSGEWIYKVGLAAKSGVGGGILAVLPGMLGLAVYSPPLDEKGNSVRGLAVCQDVSRDLGLHVFNIPRNRSSIIRSEYDLTRINSKRSRMRHQLDHIHEHGKAVQVFELQGSLGFSTVEVLVRRVVRLPESVSQVVLDLRRISAVTDAAYDILAQLIANVRCTGKLVLFSDAQVLREVEQSRKARGLRANMRNYLIFDDLDLALEWCEERILDDCAAGADEDDVPLERQDACRGLAPDQLVFLERHLELRRFREGAFIVRQGDRADEIFLLVKGKVSVTVTRSGGDVKRLSTLSAGMSFGETAYFTGAERTAEIYADTAVECYVVHRDAFEGFQETNPSLRSIMLSNLIANQAHMLRRLTAEVTTLAQQ